MHKALKIGPMLRDVMTAQRIDEEATAYPRLEAYCAALAVSCDDLDEPIVWPVGSAAERLAGAAVLLSKGRVRVRGWSSRLDGERVLVLAVGAVTPIGLHAAAQQARALGAREVHGCGIAIEDMDGFDIRAGLDGYAPLEPVRTAFGQLATITAA
jgi:hypothetical protein